jgi:hypothetical protein
MDFTVAVEILGEVGKEYGVGLLETMQYMDANFDDFSQRERAAYRIVFAGMSKLFAPA